MASASLPKDFAELSPFIGWALASECERMAKRETGQMPEIQAFYDAILPRLPAIAEYLNRYKLDAMPDDARNLLYMALSLTEASFATERYKQPLVINGKERARFYPHG